MAARRWPLGIAGCIMLLLAACQPGIQGIRRIALLAPFEGRYRELGYNAYYAALLALHDHGDSQIELLALDDGGTAESAQERLRALAHDPLISGVVVLGFAAANGSEGTMAGRLPLLVVGNWGTEPSSNTVFMLASRLASEQATLPPAASVETAAAWQGALIGGEVLALESFRRLRTNREAVRIISSGTPPNAAFREQYQSMGFFTPEPGLLATLTYDAVHLLAKAAESPDPLQFLREIDADAINGRIRFQDGWWQHAPLYTYRLDTACDVDPALPCFIAVSDAP